MASQRVYYNEMREDDLDFIDPNENILWDELDCEKKLKKAITKALESGYTASNMIDLFNLCECCTDLQVSNESLVPSFKLIDMSSFTLDPELYVESMKIFYDLKDKGEVHNLHDYMLAYNIRKRFNLKRGFM